MLACVATMSAALALVPACVTQNVQFELPNDYPPSIETPDAIGPRHPLNRLIRLDTLAVRDDAGTGSSELELEVVVRDANVQQRLEYRVFVNYDPANEFSTVIVAQGPIRPDEGRVERVLSIPLDAALFRARRCNRLELLVSGGFRNAPPIRNVREPLRAGDLATATWFVVADDSVTISECAPWN